MMYMDDAVNATIQLMDADPKKITVRTAYNLTAVSFISNVAIGTQPYAATSTTLNNNLNADLLDGLDSSAFGDATLARQNQIYAKVDNAYTACYMEGGYSGGVCGGSYPSCLGGWPRVTTYCVDFGSEGNVNDWSVCCLPR